MAAAVCIDAGVVGKWAEERHIPYTSYAELSQKPEVGALVAEAVARVNASLPPAARVRRFVNLPKEFDADDDELTRTRKLRRAFLEERYRDVVDGLYGEADLVHFKNTITYEDGRVGFLKRFRPAPHRIEIHEIPMELRAVTGPDLLHGQDTLSHQGEAGPRVGAVIFHLLTVPAGADPEDEDLRPEAKPDLSDPRLLIRRQDPVAGRARRGSARERACRRRSRARGRNYRARHRRARRPD